MLWDAVSWSFADQIASLFELSEPSAALLAGDTTPEAFFATLRKTGALNDAVSFLALALPRRAAIAWGRDCIAHTVRQAKLSREDIVASAAVSAWLDDPSDERRWTAHDAAGAAGFASPEALLAMAVFVSGGSISPPGTPTPVPAAPELTGRLAGGAVLLAAVRVPPQLIADAKSAFLDRGVEYATGAAQP
ncbi:hypothetical protein sos41_36540 [Alphaproteobacteria bacterium SO-S41]|nr:hypothetical protein sos41_36540 [Alphaproteobacteria bacterium SO-S41]